MTVKVNGKPIESLWFERDVSMLDVQVVGGAFADLAVDGLADKVIRVLQTRCTVVGWSITSATQAGFLVGHAGGLFALDAGGKDVIAELVAEINLIPGLSAAAIVKGTKFLVS